jgi:hypothetical protein
LASALAVQTDLECLLLRDANMGDNGIVAVLKAITSANIKIKVLDISGNFLTIVKNKKSFSVIAMIVNITHY